MSFGFAQDTLYYSKINSDLSIMLCLLNLKSVATNNTAAADVNISLFKIYLNSPSKRIILYFAAN